MNTARTRECGPCTACCIYLPIEAPGFYKPAGKVCLQCVEGIGCGIYATRPQPCREFLCGWRVLDLIPENLRPDLSGLVVVPDEDDLPEGYADMSGLKFVVTGDGATLQRRDVLECIAGLVHAQAPVFIAVPTGDGASFTRAFLNRRLAEAVEARNASAMALIILETLDELRRAA